MSKTAQPDPFAIKSGAPEIQGEMRPKPKLADRISPRIIWAGVLILGAILTVFLVAFGDMDTHQSQPAAKEEEAKQKEASVERGTPKELKGEQEVGRPQSPSLALAQTPAVTGAAAEVAPAATGTTGTPPTTTAPARTTGGALGVPAMGADGNRGLSRADGNDGSQQIPVLTPAQQAARDAEEKRRLRTVEARTAGLSMKGFTSGSGGGDAPGSAATNAISNLLAAAQQGAAGSAAPVIPTGLQQNTRGDAEQDEKLDFIKNASKEDRGYHQHVPLPAISPNEVKFGTYLPMQLEQDMNSDLPGDVTARITEDVYDTITGCKLLIPANSKAMGRYDSKVAIGQNRALIVWNRMYARDGSELNLAGMQAYDTSGAAGMGAEVDNHYLRLFGLAFGMSMVTASVQLSVPQSNGTNNSPTVEQAVATALAQQYGQLGAQILGKYMAVQPTLRNFVGERFTIMVPRTIVFKKVWRDRCGGAPAKVSR